MIIMTGITALTSKIGTSPFVASIGVYGVINDLATSVVNNITGSAIGLATQAIPSAVTTFSALLFGNISGSLLG